MLVECLHLCREVRRDGEMVNVVIQCTNKRGNVGDVVQHGFDIGIVGEEGCVGWGDGVYLL